MPSAPAIELEAIDLSPLEFWAQPNAIRESAFETLRREDPVRFFEEVQYDQSILPAGPGYWAVTRHAHVLEVSRNPGVFSSARGATENATSRSAARAVRSSTGEATQASISGHTARAWGIVCPGCTPPRIASGETATISARVPGPLVITIGRPTRSGLARSSAWSGRSGTSRQATRTPNARPGRSLRASPPGP